MCPHTTCVLKLQYVSSYYYMYMSSYYYMYVSSHYDRYVSSYYYICSLYYYVSSHYFVSSYSHMCVLIPPYKCPHTTIYALTLLCM